MAKGRYIRFEFADIQEDDKVEVSWVEDPPDGEEEGTEFLLGTLVFKDQNGKSRPELLKLMMDNLGKTNNDIDAFGNKWPLLLATQRILSISQ